MSNDIAITQYAEIKTAGNSFRPQLDGDGNPLTVGMPVEIVPVPDNPHDVNALGVFVDGNHVAYVAGGIAARISAADNTTGRVLHGEIDRVNHMPLGVIQGFEYEQVDGHWVSADTDPGAALSAVARGANVRAVTDRGVLPCPAPRLFASPGEAPRIAWQAPVVGFTFRVTSVGDLGYRAYDSLAA